MAYTPLLFNIKYAAAIICVYSFILTHCTIFYLEAVKRMPVLYSAYIIKNNIKIDYNKKKQQHVEDEETT